MKFDLWNKLLYILPSPLLLHLSILSTAFLSNRIESNRIAVESRWKLYNKLSRTVVGKDIQQISVIEMN